MILIFDTSGGLCNQFYDIANAINFCLASNIQFTFRYCHFRNENLVSWVDAPFEKLFDKTFLSKSDLYINYDEIKGKITEDNCYNLKTNSYARFLFQNDDILEQLTRLNMDYVVLKQFSGLYMFRNFIDNTIYNLLIPSRDLMERYIEIKNSIVKDQPYNFIHYRYERDFTAFFKVDIKPLDTILCDIKFKNNNFRIYVATSDIKNLIDVNDPKYQNLIYKNDELLQDLNFEQRAFIDYMFGIHSEECFGHSKSAFSHMINSIKRTYNFYN